ncbi:NYN domain-containing protein [Omnitrophica bacterium]|nr:NYN domain-containing protein [Candidatus Omnitrophota bacterium]
MKSYIIDAYNFIHQIPELEKLLDRNLRQVREKLFEMCRSCKQRSKDIEKIVLVFDGDSRYGYLLPESRDGVHSVYTETGEDADQRIVQILEGYTRRDHISVVSDDNFVINHARAYCARAVSSVEFFRCLTRKPKSKKSVSHQRASGEEKISDQAARRVTDEYRRHLGL